MIVFQTVLALLIHSLGRVFNMALGWATVMLFGRVPQERQIFLSVVALGSIVWLTAVIGVAFPAAAVFLLAFVSLPPWVHHTWIRIVMMIAVLVVPPLIGESSIRAIQAGHAANGVVPSRKGAGLRVSRHLGDRFCPGHIDARSSRPLDPQSHAPVDDPAHPDRCPT